MRKNKLLIIVILILAIVAGAVLGYFWYDNNVDRSGWEEVAGVKYYKDFHGNRVLGWQEIDGSTYYFTGDTSMVTQWWDVEGVTYYFGDDGRLATGWTTIGTETYYFDENGQPVTGWMDLEGKRYYLPEGVLATMWQEIDGQQYYFGQDGVMATGTVLVDGAECNFREDGTLMVGWEDGKYYLANGTLAVGWQEIDGKRYCFHEDGTLRTGWLEEGEYRYYLQEDGSAAVGPMEIDGYTYHFSPSGVEIMLVNGKNLLPEGYEPTLVLTEGIYLDECCAEAFSQMMADCRAAGKDPAVMVGYRSYWDQHFMYFNNLKEKGPSGALYVAAPNASEHQLGLAVDVVENTFRDMNKGQENTPSFKWLQEHCWDYGFILRYPNDTTDITGIAYEPWHYRYVGTEIAQELKDLGITLEEYLGAA